jgi:hypothetical protein
MFKINLIKVHDISLHLTLYMLNSQIVKYIKGSTVHIAPACVGSREGSDHFETRNKHALCIT